MDHSKPCLHLFVLVEFLIVVEFVSVELLETDLRRDFPEALPTEVQPIFRDMAACTPASPAAFGVLAELSFLWNIILRIFGELARLLLDLFNDFRIVTIGHSYLLIPLQQSLC
jgi:hypothetical protein